jgi:acetylornithine deacetylase
MPGRGGIEGAPFWSEGSFTVHQLGIPTVYCAPGDISNCHTFQERVPVAEYLAGVEAFALFMARFCGTAG